MTFGLDEAGAWLRTAEAALQNGDNGPAYESARAAAELAAKTLLQQHGVATEFKEHNVAPLLVKAGLWPGGEQGRRLSKFLADATRGVYGVGEPVTKADAERGIRLAEKVIAAAGDPRKRTF